MNKVKTKNRKTQMSKKPVIKKKSVTSDDFPFTRDNYKWLIIGCIVLAIGFILLSGGGTDDPNRFAGDTIFNTRRLVVAPIVILMGYGVVMFSIIKRTKEDNSTG